MPPDKAFDLSLSVAVHLASMARLRERVVGGIRSDSMGLGDEITWRTRQFGVPWQLTSKITAFDRPRRFVDEQVRGPFNRFHHEHFFESVGSGCRMTDVVEYEARGGLVGRVAERLLLASYVRKLIYRRNGYIAAQAGL